MKGFRTLVVALLLLGARAYAQTPREDQQELFRILPQFQSGEYQRAERDLKDALARYPRSAVLENALGILYRKLGRPADATAAFETALNILPTFTAAQLQLGAVYQEQGRTEAAIKMFARAGEEASDAGAILEAAIGVAECGGALQAIPLFEKARSKGADAPSLAYNLAIAQFKAGQNPAALETLRVIPPEGAPSDVAYLRGRIREALHDDLAREDFAAACGDSPDNADYCSAAAVELTRQERFAAALKATDAGLAKTPASEGLLTLKGMALFRLGQYSDAAASYKKVLDQNPKHSAAREGLAFLEYTTGDLDAARHTVEAGLPDAAADFYLFVLHGMILSRMSGDVRDQGIRSLEEAIRRNPSFAPAFFLRGKLRLKSGDAAGAEADFQSSAKLDPKFPLPHYQLARLYYRQGKHVLAETEEKTLASLDNRREEEVLSRQAQDMVLSASR